MTRLLLIGAAGVDWPGLTARREALPHLAGLSARGAAGWLSATPPRQGPAAWAGVAAGQPLETHRVIRAEEAWAGGLRPLTLASWGAPPVWRRLAAAGVGTASVAWPGARPGDASPGVHIDEDFAAATGPDGERWALPPHCAPPDVREALRDLRTHPTDITGAMLAPLVPGLPGVEQARDTGLPRLAVAMARVATVQTAATWLLETRRPEALFVHLGWLDEVREPFDAVGDGPFAGAVDAAWRFLDGLVGRLAELAGPEALVMVVSPGHRTNPGALIAAGPGLAAGARLTGADVADIAPTVLARFDLQDPTLPGRPLAGVGGSGPRRAAPQPQAPPVEPDAALLAAAVAAGYAAPPPASPAWRAQVLAELAAAVVERDPACACALAQEALEHSPDQVLALGIKTMGHVALGEAEPLADLGETLLRVAPDRGWGPLALAARCLLSETPDAATPWLIRAEVDKRPEMQLRVATTWIAAGRPARAARLFQAVVQATPQDASAHIGLAIAAIANRNFRQAEAALVEAARLDPARPAAHLQLAHVYAVTGRPEDARRASARAMALGADAGQAAAASQGRLAE